MGAQEYHPQPPPAAGLSEQAILAALWDASADAMALSDPEGIVLAANAAYYALYGLTAEEVIGQPFQVIFPPEQRAWAAEHYQTVFLSAEQPRALQSLVQRADGTRRVIESRVSFVVQDGRRQAMLSILRDITEQHRASQLLRESEARFRTMADSAPVLIWTSGLDKGCDYFNEPWLRFTGRTLEQERGDGWVEGVHPDDKARCLVIYNQSFDARAPFSMEYRLRRADGEYRWLLDAGVPRYTPQGEFVGYIGSCIDITERRLLLEREQDARVEAEAAVRQRDIFLSLAAHELRTPLASLLGYVQLIQRRAARGEPLPERHARMFEIIAGQTQRMSRMIGVLLDVSRIEVGQLTIERGRLDLGVLARRVVEEIQPALEHHTLVLEGDRAPLLVDGDEVRLEQVLQNLIQNALKYSPQGGAVVVRLAQQEGQASIAVTDQGIGIPEAALPNLFTRFFRADNADRHSISGTGIGLYVVSEVVALHGGRIAVQSAEGQGSTFTVYLPLAEQF
ncbi:MAG TPA: PAS domain S-box protein [Roseiflexaceae bacterium]|nr:PAS domain S-box protein [Roseiflexaceae bacterium]